ncbi:MAG TPA: VWA domain-containing protein [Pyrinomonadaceae bacterium]|jgi:VWFA-related protein
MIHQRLLSNSSLFRRLCASLVLLACLFAATTSAQQTPPDEDVVRVESNLVRLNIGVADKRGRAVTSLSQSDFVVYEDGVRQNITSFEPSNAPFSLVLLLDLSGSTLSFRATLKQSALRFVDALAPDDRIAVVTFNNKITTLQDFTTDRRRIAAAIMSVSNERGESPVYRALRYSLQQLSKEGERRKAIVVLTDGVDTEMRRADGMASGKAQTDEEAIASLKPEESPALRSVLDAADREGVTVYPLALPSGDPKRLLSVTPQQAAIYAAARQRIQTLANRTGGRLHEINRLEDMGRLYAEVAAEMRTLYTLAYQSTKAGTRDGRWRSINVEVTRADLIARTRPGYYAR